MRPAEGYAQEVQRLGDALLLQGPAVADVAYLVGLGLRWRRHVDGAQPTVHHRRLLAALTDVAVSAVPVLDNGSERGSGHADVRTSGDLPESESVGTAEAADLLGIGSRQVRRLRDELGGRLVKGAWRYDSAAVTAEAQRRKAEQ